MKRFIKFGLISVAVAAALNGCSGDTQTSSNSSNSDSTTQNNNQEQTTNSNITKGQLIDGYIAGVHYKCSSQMEGDTDVNGTFECDKLPVEFTLAQVKLGEIKKLPKDKHIFPQDLVGVDRNSTDDVKVLAMAQFLQSLDSDANLDNGIEISKDTKEALKEVVKDSKIDLSKEVEVDADKNETTIEETLKKVEEKLKNDFGKTINIVDTTKAKEHLEKSKHTHDLITKLPEDVKEHMETPASEINKELKEALAKVKANSQFAKELYNYLSKITEDGENETNEEKTPFSPIDAVISKYSIPQDMVDTIKDSFEFDLEAIKVDAQNSKTDAYKAGCAVESKNIDAIKEAQTLAKDSKKRDIFESLKYEEKSSLQNYKDYNKKLLESGVEDGCCSLGDEYCKVDNSKDSAKKDEEKNKESKEDKEDKAKDSESKGKEKSKDEMNKDKGSKVPGFGNDDKDSEKSDMNKDKDDKNDDSAKKSEKSDSNSNDKELKPTF